MNMPRRSSIWPIAAAGAFAFVAMVLAGTALILAGTALFLNAASMRSVDGLRAAMPAAAMPAPALRWDQLESGNRRTYVANLRAIGCPESAIAAIINAAEDPAGAATSDKAIAAATTLPQSRIAMMSAAGYAPAFNFQPPPPPIAAAPQVASDVLIAPVSSGDGSPALLPRVAVRSAHTAALPDSASPRYPNAAARPAAYMPAFATRLPPAGGADVSGGLQPDPAGAPVANASGNDQTITAPDGNVAIPAAFQDASKDTKITASQKSQLDALQQKFVDQISTVSQDPSSPDYRKAWQTAQWQSDQEFRALFGYQAFLDRQYRENLHLAEK
jgi:hypothetical protein